MSEVKSVRRVKNGDGSSTWLVSYRDDSVSDRHFNAGYWTERELQRSIKNEEEFVAAAKAVLKAVEDSKPRPLPESGVYRLLIDGHFKCLAVVVGSKLFVAGADDGTLQNRTDAWDRCRPDREYGITWELEQLAVGSLETVPA